MLTEIEYSPESAFCRLKHLPYIAFLDSAKYHPIHGRYSFIAADPRLIIRTDGEQTHICRGVVKTSSSHSPWEVFDALLSRFDLSSLNPKSKLPEGAAIGFLGYELANWLEPLPTRRKSLLPTPDLWFGFYDVILAFDHLEKRGWLISTGLDENGIASKAQAEFRRDQFLDELQSEITLFPASNIHSPQICPQRSASDHQKAICKALDYIRRGVLYQVNLSYSFSGYVDEHPQELYLKLRESNPAPFGAFLNYGDGQILSSSPERFLHMDRRAIHSRPIKGTCARTGKADFDWQNAASLLASAKNRAELLMITDLLRNDLGKISDYGSVKVPNLMRIEEYETVYHLVSTIEARLRPHILHLDALAACFPGGSITGAPKLKAMEIIHELEPYSRGIYTGSLGYFGFNGISDFNILIRSLIHRNGEVCFNVGGGIVAESDPLLEYEETLHKARGLLNLWAPHTLAKYANTITKM